MSAWKVILATLVIFGAGWVTGWVVRPVTVPGHDLPINPWQITTNYIEFLDRKLDLSPEQEKRLLKVVIDGQERVKNIHGLIADDLREEFHLTREEIRSELTPEQRKQYDELKQNWKRRKNGDRSKKSEGDEEKPGLLEPSEVKQ